MPPFVVPNDPDLPQLPMLLSGPEMETKFAAMLPADWNPQQPLRCTLKHLRYRAGERVVTLYRTQPEGAGTKPAWLSALSYPNDRARQLLTNALPNFDGLIPQLDLTPFAAPFHYLEEDHTLVQLFPFDLKLPALAAIMSRTPPAAFTEALEQACGGKRLLSIHCQSVRYRPLLGATLRVTVTLADPTDSKRPLLTFYTKLYPDRRAADALEQHRILDRLGAEPSDASGFRFARLAAWCAPLQALIYSAASGIALDQRLRDEPARYLLSHCAGALAKLHQTPPSGLLPRTREDWLRRISRATRLIRWACPELHPTLRQINRTLPLCLDDTVRYPTHLDIKPEHLILNGNAVTLLDGDSTRLTDPVYDIAMLLLRLRHLPPSARPSKADLAYCRDAYFDAVPHRWRQRLPLNRLCADLKLARSLVQHQRPDWRNQVHQLVDDAQQQLKRCD